MEEKRTKGCKEKAKIGGRAPNYTFAEKQTLLQLVESKKNIIENKKTDTVSMEEKNQVWQKISKEFNSVSPALIPRSCESLKKYYNNMKEDLRKRLANEKKEIYKTGGGGPPPPAERDNADKVLISIVNEKSLNGVPTSIAPYDDDYIEPNINWSMQPIINGSDTEETIEAESQSDSQSLLLPKLPNKLVAKPKPVPSCSLAILKTPLDSKLKTAIIEKNSDSNMHNQTNIDILMDLDEKRSKPLKKNSTADMKKDLGLIKSGISSRRRPTPTVKTLTSSNLGELYERLVEKKMELLDGLSKEHTQRMKLLELDEKIKLAQLNSILQAKPAQQTAQMVDIDKLIGESVEFIL